MKIAIIVARLGPYHIARLAAVGRRFGEASTIALEVARESREYAWDQVQGTGFIRRTLISTCDYHDVPKRALRRAMTRALDIEMPDVVAINGWGFTEARAAVAWCRQWKRIAILMSDSQARDARRTWLKEAYKRTLLQYFDAALVGGKRHAEYLQQLGFDADRITLGYDVVDNDFFARVAAAARVHAATLRNTLPVPQRYFVASARFVPKKNLGRLLEAFGMYRRQAGPAAWDLVLLGDGPERPRLEQLRRSLSLDSCVHMPGFKQYAELPAYYGLAKAFIHPSTIEQWGLVVNEAMACGLPVIVSSACGAAELVREGGNGYLFDPASASDLARCMVQLARDELRLDAMGAASIAAVQCLSPAGFAEALAAAGELGRRHAASRGDSRIPNVALWF